MFHIPISGLKYLCAKYTFCFILIGEKRLQTSKDTRKPPLLKKGNRGHHNLRMWRKERWLRLSPQQVMCMLWKNNLLTSRLIQRLIQDIMFCSQDLDLIKQKTNDIEQKLKNMIDVLGRI
ncbi:hypothetical protein AB205_0141660 [Aquarana catesbeiana]|uniref:Uncharacterized protein n=1 Tax=Aquarana catesbeiana TaxID=8400 RepID=A0A2G9NDB0_AQUCT|nr:hypothetical protein AB205_0141660 [Aquarana catesbeiana]